MTSTIVLFEDFDPSKIVYRDPKRTASGGLSVYVNYMKDGKEVPIRIQTPRMRAPFGISHFEAKTPGTTAPPKYTLDLSMDGHYDPASDTGIFYKKWVDFDDLNKDTSVEKSTAWFGKKLSREFVDELYTSAIKPSKKEQYPPTFKCSVPFRNNKFDCQFFDEDKKPVTGFELEKGMEVQTIVEISRLWFMGKKFGCTPVLKLVQFFPSNRMPLGYSFIEKGSDEEMSNNSDEEPSN